MAEFEEIPQVVFEVKDSEGNVTYRDAITYPSITALRADSKAEREAKFQERYDAHLAIINNPPAYELPEEPIEEI